MRGPLTPCSGAATCTVHMGCRIPLRRIMPFPDAPFPEGAPSGVTIRAFPHPCPPRYAVSANPSAKPCIPESRGTSYPWRLTIRRTATEPCTPRSRGTERRSAVPRGSVPHHRGTERDKRRSGRSVPRRRTSKFGKTSEFQGFGSAGSSATWYRAPTMSFTPFRTTSSRYGSPIMRFPAFRTTTMGYRKPATGSTPFRTLTAWRRSIRGSHAAHTGKDGTRRRKPTQPDRKPDGGPREVNAGTGRTRG